MKTNQLLRLFGALTLSLCLLISCEKSEVSSQAENRTQATSREEGVYRPGIIMPNGTVQSGGVTLTAPTTVNINENFNILAEVSCGRVAIERGYILVNNVKVYTNLACNTADLQWEELVTFQCYTTDASWTGALGAVGTYVFRTKHNAADGNCDGLGGNNQSGNCSFNGVEFYCFSIEAVNPCTTSFTGEAVTCGTARQAIYRFKSVDGEDYVKIQGGLTNFTGGDATVNVSGGTFTVSQSTPGGSSNRVVTVEGSVAACTEVVITITWTSSNSGGIITGSWSAKNELGVDIAPAVASLSCN
jgi:hypothetical protein